ncbi:3-carboxy-cis,cis-muconate cycloisomerase [Chelativorans sp. YIM 93263]|uniref:3-carboxy-cis,cis-muconate cycloisomerase n=1 Tax=Chelativorans sp. YIM 93263 TaxID=2906648 RepID=UPI0023799E41|nr:3-carboxy-cis,cis-muconate cycloisomerase [Chelativorans sp. YIM 93263]
MTTSAFDHPFLGNLLGDPALLECFSASTDILQMLRFEIALAEAEAAEDIIPKDAVAAIKRATDVFAPDMGALAAGVARDGVVVPALLTELRALLDEEHRKNLHFGATSQDVIDTSLALRLKQACESLLSRFEGVIEALAALEERDGHIEVMAHTRMQAAIPVTARRKIRSWREPLERHRTRLERVRSEVEILHFGGAAGTLDKLGDKGPAVADRLAKALDLNRVDHPRHSERDGLADFASVLSLTTGSLGKMGQDVALMAQNKMGEVELSGGGGSSAMPHKKNPVKAEALVTLARFNATLFPGLHHALVHENERSGSAWTLEWMLLPQMVMATGAALLRATELAQGISFKPSASR